MQTLSFQNSQRRFYIGLIQNIIIYTFAGWLIIRFAPEINVLYICISFSLLFIYILLKECQFCFYHRDISSITLTEEELVVCYTYYFIFKRKKTLRYQNLQVIIPNSSSKLENRVTSIVNKRNKYNGRYYLYHDPKNEESICALMDELSKRNVEITESA